MPPCGDKLPTFVEFKGTDKEAEAFVISANIRRRHLSPEHRRNIIAKLLEANPQLSDRAIAAQAKVSHHTVAGVREVTGQSAQLETRTGIDGKNRKTQRGKGNTSAKKLAKQFEDFKEQWESFNDYQQHSFVKAFKERIRELLEDVEQEVEAA